MNLCFRPAGISKTRSLRTCTRNTSPRQPTISYTYIHTYIHRWPQSVRYINTVSDGVSNLLMSENFREIQSPVLPSHSYPDHYYRTYINPHIHKNTGYIMLIQHTESHLLKYIQTQFSNTNTYDFHIHTYIHTCAYWLLTPLLSVWGALAADRGISSMPLRGICVGWSDSHQA